MAAPAQADTSAATSRGTTATQCQWVHHYRVHAAGNMTDDLGNIIGEVAPGDLFNVRIKGDPRDWGFNTRNSKWDWIPASKPMYTGKSWCE